MWNVARALKSIEVGDSPDLLRVAEEVRATGELRLLSRGEQQLAVVAPVSAGMGRRKRERSEADRQAFLASLGSWKNLIDADAFVEANYESRRRSSRPPVEL
jgi:hypothetical protein